MPSIANPEILFLFEDEIREAARRLAVLRPQRIGDDDEAIAKAMTDALNVCMAALAGAENDSAVLMLARKPDLGLKE